MKRTLLSSLVLGPALLLAALLIPGAVAAAGPITSTACTDVDNGTHVGNTAVTCNLWAETGNLTLPGTSVPIWGFAGPSVADPSLPGPVSVPGAVLVADAGDTVTVNLVNDLAVATSIVFDGQPMVPDTTGVGGGGGTKTYTFTAAAPGTYLYEAGLIVGSQYQVSMGLYGVLVVRPAGTPDRAYAEASTTFADEALVVLGEIDPKLNTSATPASFDLRNFAPKYQLVNGAAYPSTASIPTAGDNKLLLRYANAGIQHHSMGVLGLRQSVLAADGSLLTFPRDMVAETIAPGQTADVLVSMPASTAASTKYALYDAALLLNNNGGQPFGGMLAFIDAAASGTTPTDTTGPVTSNVTLDTGTGALAASVTDQATGGSGVAAAEYFIDTTGPNGTGTAMVGTPADPATVTATIAISTGSHTVYVHGKDGAGTGNWGAFASVPYGTAVDTTGPTTSALVLSPNPSNGLVSVALSATASDTATGNINVTAAEYFVGGVGANGTGTTMNLNTTAPNVSLTATIAAPVAGAVISVHSKDAAGNWGPFATITLTIDTTAPVTSNVVAAPNPNNGSTPFNSSNPSVRVTASFADAGGSTLATAEGFIDAVGSNGTGFPFSAADGVFNSASETGYADIPLTTIQGLGNGNHTISVHAKDAAGNWGATSTTTLVIDKTAPTISSVTLTPNTMLPGTASTSLAVVASDGTGVGVTGGQYWIDGSATPPASPTAFNGSSATINTSPLAAGRHTVYVRVRDGATNWSAVSSATLDVVQAVNDAVTLTANTSATQNADQAAPGLLANDQPTAAIGRTTTLTTAPVRLTGNGAGTVTLSCPAALGTAATPSISGNTVCTNGAYRVTLNGVGNNNNQRAASKRGTFSFTYTMTLNGVSSTATVTITVN